MSAEAMLAVHRLTVRTSHAAYRVLMVLAEHADKTGCNSWPAVDTIALEAQTDERTVRRCLDTLQELKLITGDRTIGRSRTTIWTLTLPDRCTKKGGVIPPFKGRAKGGVIPPISNLHQKGGITPVITEHCEVIQQVSYITPVRCETDKEGVSPPEPKKERKKEESNIVCFANSLTSSDVRQTENDPSISFETFWQAYPRRVSRAAAARAYERAITRVSPVQLLASVMAYRWPDDMQFIPHAATWLNGDRWLDDAGAAAPARRMTNEEQCDALFGSSPIVQAWHNRQFERTDHDHTLDHALFACQL